MLLNSFSPILNGTTPVSCPHHIIEPNRCSKKGYKAKLFHHLTYPHMHEMDTEITHSSLIFPQHNGGTNFFTLVWTSFFWTFFQTISKQSIDWSQYTIHVMNISVTFADDSQVISSWTLKHSHMYRALIAWSNSLKNLTPKWI